MAETMYFTIAGEMPKIAQPSDSTCWAAVGTMMVSWRDQVSYSIETAIDNLGSDFRYLFDNNLSLMPDRNEDFATATGMKFNWPRCETPESILQLLQNYGPLLVIDDETPDSINFLRHARIIIGIDGESTPSKIYLSIINPDGGFTQDELFETFTAKYESLADDSRYKVQMMHY
ncbi:hypothetical protein EXU85_18210 [Spirosoma sp. KCTC 42546]|uniref:papain-like cysteine protease family protein n=1 Tax=Spirosoma sp. KCTC 42546 TaxID=2520506 RepID=UPI0011593B01|nr:papain-like cysteine protease family protein [Spirosoma sp. KCTC 42546]QDK80433.1 hypothetical protein EXU85_18210 [Spirosoma sp. KCTC 42546]